MSNYKKSSSCPDCNAAIGELHILGCDVERCPDCGGQLISCDCNGVIVTPRIEWSGEWPGLAECREFGWYCKPAHDCGWVRCDKDDPGASEDLNRLCLEAKWDKEKRKYILKK